MERNNLSEYKLKSTANTIKEILTIIMAIAFTTAIMVFLGWGRMDIAPREFQQITVESFFAFFAVLTGIIRFFHGNTNYLKSIYNVPDYIAFQRKYNYRLGIDFVFLFFQAILFCALAIYQLMTSTFYAIFTVLFFTDAVWFFIIYGFTKRMGGVESKKPEESAPINWMVTNFITAIIMLMVLFWTSLDLSKRVWILFGIIMLNTLLDYGLNWDKLYFPSLRTKDKSKVFVAARFTTAIDTKGEFDSDLQEKIKAVHDVIKNWGGFDLISAHQREKFGKEKYEAEIFTPADLRDISECSVFVLLLDENISAGAFTELGWASVLDKIIIILVPKDVKIENVYPIVEGIHKITPNSPCRVIRYDKQSIDNLKENLKNGLQTFFKMNV